MPDSRCKHRHEPVMPDAGARAGAIRLVRRGFLALSAAVILVPSPAQAENIYSLNQRFGTIGFAVNHLGLFKSEGQFRKFDASLTIDAAHPERTRIAVDVAAASVDMSWQNGAAMLRSADFFDVQRFPDIRFRSTAVVVRDPHRYIIQGLLEVRGIVQPCTLDAALMQRRIDPATNTDIADFVVTGALRRSAFGMTADRIFISDVVQLKITARIQLSAGSDAG